MLEIFTGRGGGNHDVNIDQIEEAKFLELKMKDCGLFCLPIKAQRRKTVVDK